MIEPVPVTREWLAMQDPSCSYRGCENKPTHKISPPGGGRAWLGCARHKDEMIEALSLGFGFSDTAHVTSLPRRRAV